MDTKYTAPSVTEYGSVESMTLSNEKCDGGSDEYEESTPLEGSIQECKAA